MATTVPSFSPHRSSLLEFPRTNRPLPPFCVRFSAKSQASGSLCLPHLRRPRPGTSLHLRWPHRARQPRNPRSSLSPSAGCVLQWKAFDSCDMFDRVELKLRWYGSKSVVKYPRCSIRRQSTYADAEADLSMIFALASTWIVFLAFGSTICAGPVLYTVSMAYHTIFNSGLSYVNQASGLGFLSTSSIFKFLGLNRQQNFPYLKVLQGLWRNDLVALKGACPNCGGEVFAFVRMDRASDSPHRADCHVCGCLLEFHTQVEELGLRAYLPRFALRQIPAPKTTKKKKSSTCS